MSMKKFLVVCLSLLCLMFTFGLTACGDKDNNELIDLADCEIGYELPVYPSCEFDYKVNDDCVVHISSIKAVLVKKNEIHEGDLLTENFTPYIVELRFLGRTDASNVDKNIKVRLNLQITSISIRTAISRDGEINGTTIAYLKYTPTITFETIYLSEF